jgi:2-polyprenyl-6-hydroxyphenyl methylase/3-demethylubiquinone-9 3-methyltransferase
MGGYYTEKLAADRLRRVYALGSPAVQAYLQGEIDFVREQMRSRDRLLELGCGYGRVLAALAAGGATDIWGIDTSAASLHLARRELPAAGVRLAAMDALTLAFPAASFDRVICIQNGISAFGVDPLALVREALRVTRPGGRVLFSSYAERFWPHRLTWFEAQAAAGLLGEIDRRATGDGVIVCKDGFRARTFGAADFRRLADRLGLAATIREVAGSSLFCVLSVD